MAVPRACATLLPVGAPAVSLWEDSLRAPDCPGGDTTAPEPPPSRHRWAGRAELRLTPCTDRGRPADGN